MTTLTDFLLARIAEDETAVQALLEDGWPHDGSPSPTAATPMARVGRWEVTSARVLAECEALRHIVEEHGSTNWHTESLPDVPLCNKCRDQIAPCPTLRALATIYADHEDFDPAWRLT